MAMTLSTGLTLSVAKTYGSSFTVSAATNAAQCQLTTTGAHSYNVGDYIEVTSGWDLLDARVVRCATGTTGTTIVLEGVDTQDTNLFPASGGTGSVRKISTWTQVTQLKSISSSGGTQNFADVTTLSNLTEKKIPTTKGSVEMTIDAFDDPTLTWFADVTTADNSKRPYGMLMTFKNGSKLCGNAYWGVSPVPSIAQNEALTVQVSLSYAAQPIRYAS